MKPIREVKADFLQWRSAFIGLPKRVEIAVSADGERFTVLGGEENDLPFDDPKLQCRAFGWTARPKPAMSAATPSRTAIRAAGCLSTKLS